MKYKTLPQLSLYNKTAEEVLNLLKNSTGQGRPKSDTKA